MDWMKDLSESEQEHLKDMKIKTLVAFKAVAANQKEHREKFSSIEPCWQCKRIAKKLGLPV